MIFHFRSKRLMWTAAVAVLLLLVLLTGDSIRMALHQELRFALCLTGAGLLALSTLAYILSPAGPFGLSHSDWVKIAGSAALVGLLLFVLFVQDMECELRSSGRGISTVCKEIGS